MPSRKERIYDELGKKQYRQSDVIQKILQQPYSKDKNQIAAVIAHRELENAIQEKYIEMANMRAQLAELEARVEDEYKRRNNSDEPMILEDGQVQNDIDSDLQALLDQLKDINEKYKQLIDQMYQLGQEYNAAVNQINAANANYANQVNQQATNCKNSLLQQIQQQSATMSPASQQKCTTYLNNLFQTMTPPVLNSINLPSDKENFDPSKHTIDNTSLETPMLTDDNEYMSIYNDAQQLNGNYHAVFSQREPAFNHMDAEPFNDTVATFFNKFIDYRNQHQATVSPFVERMGELFDAIAQNSAQINNLNQQRAQLGGQVEYVQSQQASPGNR